MADAVRQEGADEWNAPLARRLGAELLATVQVVRRPPTLGRLVHRRWKVRRVPLTDAPAAFEDARRAAPGAQHVVLCPPFRLTVRST